MNQKQIITIETLEEYGVDVSEKDVASFLEYANSTLEERVGAEVAESLDDEKLSALVELQETGNNEQVASWLRENVPELQQIAEDELDILLGELSENADSLSDSDS
ncbi:hypothetical protein H6796_00890 [Candidatus Nomurabacteria bacterium]|nr:hypothetical protein [Candidatus Nomurabacteria bacterium]